MGSTNKVMEAKNRKVRMYDMEHNNYVNNGVVSLEYKYHECEVPTDGTRTRRRYTLRQMYFKDKRQEKHFENEYACMCAKIRMAVGGC